MIHAIAAAFLFKILILLLSLKKNNLNRDEVICIAGLATILWAAHPIQTQAVTYIVQRMASLAGMFYLIGLWFYLKFRCNTNASNSKYSIAFSFLFFSCAVLSKENAVLFPFGIVFVEMFFFNGFKKIQAHSLKLIFIAGIAALVLTFFFFHETSVDSIMSAYENRPFTLKQRLLTEPRILFFHIGQILYPIPGRFSISHSFVLSDTLFSPISTFFSISGIGILLIFAFWKGKKYPLIGFPIVFYFSHHLIESSVIPLELIFEHRNYLPSVFIFLPVAYGLVKLLTFYKRQNKIIFCFVFLFCLSLIFLFGLTTHIRNLDWQTNGSLWKSAAKTAPDLLRPYIALGWYYTSTDRANPAKARYFYQLGLDKNESYNIFEKTLLWINIAKTYDEENNYIEAEKSLLKCLAILEKEIKDNPDLLKNDYTNENLANVNYYLANINIYLNRIDKALLYIDQAIRLKKSPAYYNVKARILIYNKHYSQANELLQFSLKKKQSDWNTYFMIGNTLTAMKYYSKGRWFYNQAHKVADNYQNPQSQINLYIADNLYLSGKENIADQLLLKYLKNNSINKTINFIKSYQKLSPEHLPLINHEIIFLKLHEGIQSILKEKR
jgi:tetratricopeptide (TPR) repeat protein